MMALRSLLMPFFKKCSLRLQNSNIENLSKQRCSGCHRERRLGTPPFCLPLSPWKGGILWDTLLNPRVKTTSLDQESWHLLNKSFVSSYKGKQWTLEASKLGLPRKEQGQTNFISFSIGCWWNATAEFIKAWATCITTSFIIALQTKWSFYDDAIGWMQHY